MKLEYVYDKKLLSLKEAANENDIEFSIKLLEPELKNRLQKVREYFDDNDVLTDLLYYIHPQNKYQVIVKKDFYNEFIIQLFRFQLIQAIRWS
ncbi:hypothetical protein [Neobacillus jeddahensis]|uniref:hypothetical protein n=1 Tax=Neobacillus jeddahensis TaxID=1461580 RepID=UPI00058F9FBB|nr:hypothetical protein [Neobacillus jeddahensis]